MLKIYKLNTVEGIDNYKGLLSSLEVIDPYSLPDYFTVFSGGTADLICFCFTSVSNGVIVMPGYLKPIVIGDETTAYFDFSSPYGYTGPFFAPEINASDILDFWNEVDKWYLENNIVTEFIRFNLSGNQACYSGKIFPTMLNIKGRIIDEEKQWAAFDYKVRKNVNRARKENLSSTIFYGNLEEDQILEFYTIYIETMKRTNATERFSYTFGQFKDFIIQNNEYAAICTVYFQEKAVSSELLLVSGDTIYSFLGGTDDRYFDKRPNDFLKVEALNWARAQGKKYYVLGGGYGFEDGIFKYKKAFFPNDVVNYYTGRKTVNAVVYEELVEKANLSRLTEGLSQLEADDVSFFPLYSKLN